MSVVAGARSISVKSLDDIRSNEKAEGCKFVIKRAVDLRGSVIVLPRNSKLKFKKGFFVNGTVIGNQTILTTTKNNVFRNCSIKGSWVTGYSYSTMFDNDLKTIDLLRNMSCLSPHLKLSCGRRYQIEAKGEEIDAESISSIDRGKPTLEFHTSNPNVTGLTILGDHVVIKNIIIKDDYDIRNDGKYGENKVTIGNTIGVESRKKTVSSLIIEDCVFTGGTSSSYVASSQVKNCQVKGCSFSGYMADHGVYCSTKVETFDIGECEVFDVTHATGVFKVRSSKKLKSFSLRNVNAHNLNGYIIVASLENTPELVLSFENLSVTKDSDNQSVFYGFCVTDEAEVEGKGFNAKELVIKDCGFDYGYSGASLVYPGSGKMASIKSIEYVNTTAKGSNFGGGNCERLIVNHCVFEDCCGKKGIALRAKSFSIANTTIVNHGDSPCEHLFLINQNSQEMEAISMRNVKININARSLFNIVKGKGFALSLKDNTFTGFSRNLVSKPSSCSLDIENVNNRIDSSIKHNLISTRN